VTRAPLAGRYRLVRLIARGGMAEVWEGVDEVLARPVAVKVLLPHLAQDDAFVRRFRQEAVAAARLSHPHIVALFDTCSDGGTEAIVMELVRGSTLREVLDQEGPLHPRRVASIGAQVADALSHAHMSGLIHRDVKPGNILLSDHGRVLVADFGIAKAAEGSADLTEVGQIVGTAKYLSPEQVEGTPLDARSDLYSLGVVLYEAACGRPPFSADTPTSTALARLTSDPARLGAIRPGVPPALEEVILKAMAREPRERYGTANELRQALLGIDASLRDVDPADRTSPNAFDATGALGPTATFDRTPPAGVTPTTTRRRRSWIVPTLLIAIVVLTVGLVALLISRTEIGADLFGGGGDDETPPTTDAPAEPGELAVAGVEAFDPQGDGGENDGSLDDLIDGDAETSWTTERYNTPDLGGLKDGVGVVLDLEAAGPLARLEVDSPSSGWAAAVYVADQAAPTLAGWGEVRAEGSGIDGDAVFDLAGATGRHVLLWFTNMGDGRVGPSYRVQVDELRLVG
jgi:serine/threonine-protein kinase